MHRFFISSEQIKGNEVFFPSDLAHQMTRVLRLREADRVVVLDNRGVEYEVGLHTLTKRSVQGTICETRAVDTEPRTHLTLYMALLKGKKLDWVLQKGTELGVSRFVPFLSHRSVVGSLKSLGKTKVERWRRIVREAAEQSHRGRLPEVLPPQSFEAALDQARASGALSLIAWEVAGGKSLKQALNREQPSHSTPPRRINLFIGPEGGFQEEEIITAQKHRVLPITLGSRILRAETAALAATTAVLYELGEWERKKP
ncbi:MAG: 16S rRNA (uracil(1498)-N(3))-methyltransferase [Ardenticatenaceae bacterium]